jgi:hypothetical protein
MRLEFIKHQRYVTNLILNASMNVYDRMRRNSDIAGLKPF